MIVRVNGEHYINPSWISFVELVDKDSASMSDHVAQIHYANGNNTPCNDLNYLRQLVAELQRDSHFVELNEGKHFVNLRNVASVSFPSGAIAQALVHFANRQSQTYQGNDVQAIRKSLKV